jgi:hypothetical protein
MRKAISTVVRGNRAGRRHQGEAGRADQEEAAAAEHVAEPGAGDQEDGEGEGVAGAQPLQGGVAAAEGGLDRGTGDVDDRRVHQVHHVRRDHHREDEPAQRVECGSELRRGGRGGGFGAGRGGEGLAGHLDLLRVWTNSDEQRSLRTMYVANDVRVK